MQNVQFSPPNLPRAEVSTGELVREAVKDARQLIQLEVQLARDEMKRELVAARSSAIAFGVSALLLVLGLSLVLVAIALFIFPGPVPALILGLILLAAAGLGASLGKSLLPKKPLEDTRRRLETGIEAVKEQVQREHA